jgi:glycopeptide antibiotics resistance protein
LRLADIKPIYYVVALLLIVLITVVSRKLNLGLLAGYLFFALAVTVLNRSPFTGNHFQPQLFWSWSVPRLRDQIIMNVIGFIPIGFLLASVLPSIFLSIPIASLISLSIELLQLITSRGLFEFDDFFHNTLGAVIGVVVFMLWRWFFSSTRVEDGLN